MKKIFICLCISMIVITPTVLANKVDVQKLNQCISEIREEQTDLEITPVVANDLIHMLNNAINSVRLIDLALKL